MLQHSEGSATSFSRSDHTHAIASASANTITPDASASEGTATSFSRSDHTHGIVTDTPVNVDLGANSEGTSTSFARADHKHDLDESIVPTWTGLHTFQNGITANTAGTVDIDVAADFDAAVQMDQVTINTTDGDFAIAGNGIINNTVNMQNGPNDVIYWGTNSAEYRIVSDASSYIEIDGTVKTVVKPKLHVSIPAALTFVTDDYSVRALVSASNGQHYQSGVTDYEQNYAMMGTHVLSSDYDTNFANGNATAWGG